MPVDDRYTSGVWYDEYNGDFCKIQLSDDGELVELVVPETGDVYWDMSVTDWENEQSDFRKVSDEAVEDPVSVVNRALRIMSRNSIEELAAVSFQFGIDLRYARQQVHIREQSEDQLLSEFYDEVRESLKTSMIAEGIDPATAERVAKTVDDNV